MAFLDAALYKTIWGALTSVGYFVACIIFLIESIFFTHVTHPHHNFLSLYFSLTVLTYLSPWSIAPPSFSISLQKWTGLQIRQNKIILKTRQNPSYWGWKRQPNRRKKVAKNRQKSWRCTDPTVRDPIKTLNELRAVIYTQRTSYRPKHVWASSCESRLVDSLGRPLISVSDNHHLYPFPL